MNRLPERLARRIVIDPDTGCWLWQGAKGREGYGHVKDGGRTRYAHIVAYEAVTGQKVLPGFVHRHLCNRPACINPAHILVGTQADNMADRELAGHTARGSKNGRSKLDEGQVRELWGYWQAGLATLGELAALFGMSVRGVRSIVEGRNWRQVTRGA